MKSLQILSEFPVDFLNWFRKFWPKLACIAAHLNLLEAIENEKKIFW